MWSSIAGLHGDKAASLPPPAQGMSSQITGVKQTTAQGGSSLDNPFSRTVCGSFLQLSKVKQWGEIQF